MEENKGNIALVKAIRWIVNIFLYCCWLTGIQRFLPAETFACHLSAGFALVISISHLCKNTRITKRGD